jgi:hypothetical protein
MKKNIILSIILLSLIFSTTYIIQKFKDNSIFAEKIEHLSFFDNFFSKIRNILYADIF